MKAAFNIPPKKTGNDPLSLLIEAGDHSISFIWFIKAPFTVTGLVTYNISTASTITDIKTIFSTQEASFKNLSSVTICYDYKQSLLIPGKYNQATINKEVLSLVYGEDDKAIVNNDLITSAGIYNHYRIPNEIGTILSERFPKADIFHSTSLQMEQLNQEKDLLYCIIYHNIVKVTLYRNGKLQIVQQFNYSIPEDVAYHLLNVCEQFAVKPGEIQLRLSGMIDEHSKLYIEIYQYFLNISFENVADGIYSSNEINELPAHFFSHLTSLALCVS